jgi:dedicated sortase system histidine kinase
MNLKRQLLLVSLLTLVLPWAGCEFVRETEKALRSSQQQMLSGTARAVAESLETYPEEFPSPSASRHSAGDQLYGHALEVEPLIDGYFDDWLLDRSSLRSLRGTDGTTFFATGLYGRWLYLYAEVKDASIVFKTAEPGSGDTYADRVLLTSANPPMASEILEFAAEAPGTIVANRQTSFSREPAPEPTAQARWQDVPGGYQLEARVPLNLLGTNLGLTIVNTAEPGSPGIRSSSFEGREPGPFVSISNELTRLAENLAQPGMRLMITDYSGWRVAMTGEPGRLNEESPGPVSAWLRFAYSALLEASTEPALAEPDPSGREQQDYVLVALGGERSESWFRSQEGGQAIVAVAEPITFAGEVIGTLILQRGTYEILSLTNETLARLMYMTVIATLLVAATLLGYATWLSRRIRRLSVAAEDALESDDLRRALPSDESGDEVGDLSRSFSYVLRQLADYNDYLRTLASKLSHELRTPLAIVTSSLDNLEHEELSDASAGYTARAKDGADRLRRILSAMSEASRVEELMQHAEAERFDLRRVLKSTVSAYRDVYENRQFEFDCEIDAAVMEGSPELVIQMLDKLVDNAAEFSAAGDIITISLAREDDSLVLGVENPGPPLPERMRSQLFDSMVSVRPDGSDKHLGLGLFVAKIIAEGHRGSISARNTGSGVRFSVSVPVADPQLA